MTVTHVFSGLGDLRAAAGRDLGHSEWVVIDQKRIDRFADATHDRQWIHVDVERARTGPHGSTIAQGFLTLSLWPELFYSMVLIRDIDFVINYGLDRVRFPAPVRSGARVRASIKILSVDDVPGGVQLTYLFVVSAEDTEKPSCVAHILIRYLMSGAESSPSPQPEAIAVSQKVRSET